MTSRSSTPILSYASSATAGTDALNLFTQVQETQQGDVYPGSFGTDVYFGRTSAMMPKISLFFQITYWLDQSWGSYYMDFTSIYGQPSQFHTTRIIQKDISWLFGHRAFDWYLQSVTRHSPYSIEPISGDADHVRTQLGSSPSTYSDADKSSPRPTQIVEMPSHKKLRRCPTRGAPPRYF